MLTYILFSQSVVTDKLCKTPIHYIVYYTREQIRQAYTALSDYMDFKLIFKNCVD